jgi:urea carboxylase
MSFDTVLIANRGAIATRIIRTLKRMGLRSVAVYSEADEGSLHVALADEAVCIGAAPATESYLNAAAIIAAAKATGAGAIHPGYGFLAENAEFADACAAAGSSSSAPRPRISAPSASSTARALWRRRMACRWRRAATCSPMRKRPSRRRSPSATRSSSRPLLAAAASACASARMTMPSVRFATVARLGESNFGDAGVFLERYVRRARHVEVQIFGDGAGRVVALGERDCSLQRRNQKVVEEAPAPLLPDHVRRI